VAELWQMPAFNISMTKTAPNALVQNTWHRHLHGETNKHAQARCLPATTKVLLFSVNMDVIT